MIILSYDYLYVWFCPHQRISPDQNHFCLQILLKIKAQNLYLVQHQDQTWIWIPIIKMIGLHSTDMGYIMSVNFFGLNNHVKSKYILGPFLHHFDRKYCHFSLVTTYNATESTGVSTVPLGPSGQSVRFQRTMTFRAPFTFFRDPLGKRLYPPICF